MSNNPFVYQISSRKYRPMRLNELWGQDHLVTTLTHAIDQNRLPHAFLFHGIRGVGKTTTARILAKAVNCIGEDGKKGPTPNPCNVCEHCQAISQENHLDVIEMDAASRTGVDDVREIIDTVRYKTVSARFKVYIIDEVHMLSKNAFNALLKTLEEPPAHVKFIFATTEIKKIPETILSRCMRFDLKRLTAQTIHNYLKDLAEKENISVEDTALAYIARAGEGSMRDCLSLFDQAVSLGGGTLSESTVIEMLGIADHGAVYSLLNHCFTGKPEEALALSHKLQEKGGDPVLIAQEMLEAIHWIACLKTAPNLLKDQTRPQSDRELGSQLATQTSMAHLLRAWQIMNEGHLGLKAAFHAGQHFDILLLKLSYLSQLPPLEELLENFQKNSHSNRSAAFTSLSSPNSLEKRNSSIPVPLIRKSGQAGKQNGLHGQLETTSNPLKQGLGSFQDIIRFLEQHREGKLYGHLIHDVHFVALNQSQHENELVIRLASSAPVSLTKELKAFLDQSTGQSWSIRLTQEQGEPTLGQQEIDKQHKKQRDALNHPFVKTLLDSFPGSEASFKEKYDA